MCYAKNFAHAPFLNFVILLSLKLGVLKIKAVYAEIYDALYCNNLNWIEFLDLA